MNKYKNKIMLGVLLLFFLISIGFALLTTTLNIEGNTTAKANTWDIYFDNIQVKTGSITPVQAATINKSNKTQLSFNVNLNLPGNYYEFDVDVVNKGTIDAMIDSYEILPVLTTEQSKYFNYTVKYKNESELNEKDLLAAQSRETLNVRIEFKKNIKNSDLSSTDTTISPSVTINYIQATEDAEKVYGPAILLSTTEKDKTKFRSDEYKQKIKKITFERGINVPENAVDSWDIGVNKIGDVMSYLVTNEEDNTMYDLHIQSNKQLYANKDMSYWFSGMQYVESIEGLELINTSKTTDMSSMFLNCWTQATNDLNLDLSSWDTSNVKRIESMFAGFGYNVKNVDLNLSNWDTSNVTDMSGFFEGYLRTQYGGNVSSSYSLGANANSLMIRGLSDWDTGKVTNMNNMFFGLGYRATTWNIGNLSNWDVSNVTDMGSMFREAGENATTWNIGDLSNWNTSNLTIVNRMFYFAGTKTSTFDIGNIGNWNISKVTDLSSMFWNAGRSSATFNIGDLSNWDTSNVTNMYYLFMDAGENATTWSIGNVSGWNTSKVTNMGGLFGCSGTNAPTWYVGDLSNWDTSNVTKMSQMFLKTGENSQTFNLGDIGKWNTSKVTDMSEMFSLAGSSATTWNIGDLSGWDTSNVTTMYKMFRMSGQNATTWNIGDLSEWDTSNVTNMSEMFEQAGFKSQNKVSPNVSGWNVSKVTNRSYFNNNSQWITPPVWVR